MGLEELKWQRDTSLKEMMTKYNRLVDEMAEISQSIADVAGTVSKQHEDVSEKIHELNDKILTVNYKTDAMQRTIDGKLDDILRSMERNHPTF